MTELEKALNKAKLDLLSKYESIFITTILFSMKLKWKEDLPFLGGTDYKSIFLNPKRFLELSREERVGLIAHETWHVAFSHGSRVGNRDRTKWNIACDYVINLMLTNAGYTIPKGGLLDQQYEGMSAEQIYDLLPDNMINPYGLDFEINPDDQTSKEVEDIIIKAATAAAMEKQAGTVPKEIADFVQELTNPKLPWYTILYNYFFSKNKDDYSWERPNRRFSEVYMPIMESEGCGPVFVFPDTSGSITDEEYQEFITETKGILDIADPEEIHIVNFDHKLYEPQIFRRGEDITEAVRVGRGGTSFNEVIRYINDNKPELSIIFTDGYSYVSEPEPKTPVIWVVKEYPEFKAPFGKLIHF